MEPTWVLPTVVRKLHRIQIDHHGGRPGVRADAALESALARPRNIAAYEDPNICRLAAAYAQGIVRNHPFIDGNKRTAFLTAYVFLEINGFVLVAEELDATRQTINLAVGEITESEFARFLDANTKPIP